jgi:pimeloyl-ACP methyl ester carboxylesterase
VGVVGASYGGYLAALLTARRPVARLALRAPALYEDASVDVPRALRGRSDDPPGASSAVDALRSFHGAVLIVESEHDESVPPAMLAAYRSARPDARRVVIAGAGHELSQPEWRQAFLSALLDFFAEL